MSRPDRKPIIDVDLQLKDAGLIAASAACLVDGAAKILDLGTGLMKGVVFVDVSAIEIASNGELYSLIWQLSSSATFASVILNAARFDLGANEVIPAGADQDSTIGIKKFPVWNSIDGGQNIYRYARLYTLIEGAIATGGGINYLAWLTK